jgi:hypothetical protein
MRRAMKFYVLDDPEVEDGQEPQLAVTDFVEADPVNRGSPPLCPVCHEPIGMLPWLPPYRAELQFWGREAGDIAIGFGSGEILVSDRFRLLWERARLVGLSGFEKVEVVKTRSYGKKKGIKPSSDYYYVAIARSRAAVDDEASELVRPQGLACQECRRGDPEWAKRIVLEKNTWSGEDIFYVRGLPGRIMTSERYRDFHVENEINNGILIEASQYSFDWRFGEGYKPG